MAAKPIVTCAGEASMYNAFRPQLMECLPQEPIEWRRSYGRTPKSVHLDADLITLDEFFRQLREARPRLTAALHTFWTDCADVDTYRSTVKDQISNWLVTLRRHSLHDWLIIHVDTTEGRKGANKLLPRTTVMDRIKSDFTTKQEANRCISVWDPNRTDPRAVESWNSLMFRMRQLFVNAYAKVISQYESDMRGLRERRTDPTWRFNSYFLVQEELALVFELVSLHEDALLQYDELDALLSQFIINAGAGDIPPWIHCFIGYEDTNPEQCPVLTTWPGLSLSKRIISHLRSLILEDKISLLELRNYLFARQCLLLLLLNRPWELCERALPFLRTLPKDLERLNLSLPPGALAAWGFLSVLEILNAVSAYQEQGGDVDSFSHHTAPLWEYARKKLYELGSLCGLLPGESSTSAQLHLVVQLIAGLELLEEEELDISNTTSSTGTGNRGGSRGRSDRDSGSEDSQSEDDEPFQTPLMKLKEAISSQDAFRKQFLEFCELAMGTYKHIGHFRAARLIGQDLAGFYLKMNEPQQAISFYKDSLKVYAKEGWLSLVGQALLQMAHCQELMGDWPRLARSCAQIAACGALPHDDRRRFWRRLWDDEKLLKARTQAGEPISIPANAVLEIISISLPADSFDVGTTVVATLEINSRLVEPMQCSDVRLLVRPQSLPDALAPSPSPSPVTFTPDSLGQPEYLDLEEYVEYNKTGRSATMATLQTKDINLALRRKDSQAVYHREVSLEQSLSMAQGHLVADGPLTLTPGHNVIQLQMQADEKSLCRAVQLIILDSSHSLQLLESPSKPFFTFKILSQAPSLAIYKTCPGNHEILSGTPQVFRVCVTAGSNSLPQGAEVLISGGRGLVMAPVSSVATDPLSLAPDVFLSFPWLPEHPVVEAKLSFTTPFSVHHTLHTADQKKFVHVVVQSHPEGGTFSLESPMLSQQQSSPGKPDGPSLQLKLLNPADEKIVVNRQCQASYMWEVFIPPSTPSVHLKAEFSVAYQQLSSEEAEGHSQQRMKSVMEYRDFQTIYTLRSKVEPLKGSEFCRSKVVCMMTIQLLRVLQPVAPSPVMFEVLADPSTWAIVGRSSGVLNVDSDSKEHVLHVEVMPLVSGSLSIPSVRISRYLPASSSPLPGSSSSMPRLEAFAVGQVYNFSKTALVHVISPSSGSHGLQGTPEQLSRISLSSVF
ncbi:unnamed protein product [Cyprideis torosa]|uniref:Trafficking protein particle complex subunit 10 n=1 Tax=Cyprideis torosa TaxID=163714 RepID=A0A7R8ZLL8_9CRUS|nr:unnamed protein product [Cyprideis torosa]CAG0892147.1 unnamed protein product [Cyprideis torosa]